MNYLILFDDVTGRFDKKEIHEKITKHLSATNWWHYLSNAYILVTPVSSAGITNSLAGWYPGMLFLVIKIDVNDASGVLPKEAFDWLRNRGRQNIKITSTPQPKLKVASPQPLTIGDLLRNVQQPQPTTPQTQLPKSLTDIFKSGRYK